MSAVDIEHDKIIRQSIPKKINFVMPHNDEEEPSPEMKSMTPGLYASKNSFMRTNLRQSVPIIR